MRRQHETNENTGAHFDALYAGRRRSEMMPLEPLQVLLPALCVGETTGAGRGNILDLGCGYGQYYPYLSRSGARVWGVDFAEAAIAEAKLTHPDGRWKCWDFGSEGIPYGPDVFHNVVCLETLEHVPDPAALIREIHRVLAPGGLAILGVPYREELAHVEEHLWAFDEEDWTVLMEPFAQHTTFRYGVGTATSWEHFLVLGVK